MLTDVRRGLAALVGTLALVAVPGPVHAESKPWVPGSASVTKGSIYGDTIVFTIQARKVVEGSSVVVRVERCDGTWLFRKVSGRTGSFQLKVTSAVRKLPNRVATRVVLRHPDYKSKVEELHWRLEGQGGC